MKRLLSQRGLTLAELMIAVALIGIGIMAAIGSFNSIQKSIQTSKGRTIAANLAQEKMQLIMQKSYYEILVSTSPAYDSSYSPALPYDTTYFPPEALTEGGMQFTRRTFIQVVQENSRVIQVLPPTTPDTGIRQITIYVLWQSATGPQYLSIQNVINNPNTVQSNAIVKGQVKDSVTNQPIANAVVDIAENVGWRDNSDASGFYSINLSPGTFDFVASAPGYYNSYFSLTVAPDATLGQDLTLTPISSGTVQGTAWLTDHVVISQVVASTVTTTDTEYIELYNPTASGVNMGAGDPTSGSYWSNWNSFFYYYDHNGNTSFSYITYISTFIPASSYYLIANTTTVTVNGVTRQADAIYGPASYSYVNGSPGANFLSPGHMIQPGQAGGLIFWLNSASGWNVTDRVGWQDTSAGQSAPSVAVEPTDGTGSGIASIGGLAAGEQFARKTGPTTVNASFGRAYDSNNNVNDFIDFSFMTVAPANSAITQVAVTGTPADGAVISMNDGVSASVKAVLTGSPAYALFTVPGVATGTWTAIIDSGTVSAEIDNISVTGNTTTSVPNAATSPVWPTTNLNATVLNSPRLLGLISGLVTDIHGAVISPAITVTAGGVTSTVGPTGRYSLRLTTGTYDVTVNPSNINASYAAVTQAGVMLSFIDGDSDVDFQLSQSGKITGWVSRDGVNPLPGVSVVAMDVNGSVQDSEVSGSNGSFTLINLTTGSYTVEPVLDPKETASPTSNTGVTVAVGSTVSAGTFTVTGAMGTLTGSVQVSGQPINTGVLVVVSTTTIPTPPPSLSSASLTSTAYYSGSSLENGTYSVDVRGSSTTVYHVAAYYMYLSNQTPVISSSTASNITITAGQTTSGVNFSW